MRFGLKEAIWLLTVFVAFFAGWGVHRAFSPRTHVRPYAASKDHFSDVAVNDILFNASAFRKDIERLVSQSRYGTAAWLMMQSTNEELIAEFGDSYIVVDAMIGLEGANREYDPDRDWIVPRHDSAPSQTWIQLWRRFAKGYNSEVDAAMKRNTPST
jgi:hypothetical protein